jgi:putative ABC transport system permease protein
MLGRIGLLLGIMSFVIVVRKNLASRRNEICIYRSLGFPEQKIISLLQVENNAVPVFAIVTGFLGALLAAGGGITNIGWWIWLTSSAFSIIFLMCVLVFIKKEVKKRIIEK